MARISVAEILDGIRKKVRTSTAHQFLMKDLRTGPGISNKDKYLGGVVERERAVFLVAGLVGRQRSTSLVPEQFSHVIDSDPACSEPPKYTQT